MNRNVCHEEQIFLCRHKKRKRLGALSGEKWRGALKLPCYVLRHARVSKHRRPQPLCFDWTCQNHWQKAQQQRLPNTSIIYCGNSTTSVVKNVNYYFGKLRKKQQQKKHSVRQLRTSRIALCFSSAGQVNMANSLCLFGGRQVCRMAADLACAVHWTVVQCMWRKSIRAPLLLSPWSSVSIPPVSEVVFALQKKKENKPLSFRENSTGPSRWSRAAHSQLGSSRMTWGLPQADTLANKDFARFCTTCDTNVLPSNKQANKQTFWLLRSLDLSCYFPAPICKLQRRTSRNSLLSDNRGTQFHC